MANNENYTPISWTSGDILTYEKMNHIESGIASIGEEIQNARGRGANSGTLGARIDDLIMVQSTQPTSENNEIWINNSATSQIEIPTQAEFLNLSRSVSSGMGNTFDPTHNYTIGEFFTRNNTLYYVKTNRSAGEWRDSDVNENGPFVGAALGSYIGRTAGLTAYQFNPTSNYSAGDYVIYDYRLYQFTTNFTHTGVFPSTGIRRAYLGEDVKLLQTKTDNITVSLSTEISTRQAIDNYHSGDISNNFDPTHDYTIGEFFIKNNVLYYVRANRAAAAWRDTDTGANGPFILAALGSYIGRTAELTARMFNPASDYSTGDYVIYDYHLYQFTSDFTHNGNFPTTGIRRTYLSDDLILLANEKAAMRVELENLREKEAKNTANLEYLSMMTGIGLFEEDNEINEEVDDDAAF